MEHFPPSAQKVNLQGKFGCNDVIFDALVEDVLGNLNESGAKEKRNNAQQLLTFLGKPTAEKN